MINPNNAPLSIFTGCPGWESDTEQSVLYALASHLLNSSSFIYLSNHQWVGRTQPPPLIVEIGSEFGMSASIFRKAAPYAKLICIELNPQAMFTKNLEEAGLYNIEQIEWVIGDSKTLEIEFEQPIDLLFVDGDHSFNGAQADLMKYAPHVAVGGFVCVHDCDCATNKDPHPSHIAVRTAVQWWLAERGHKDGFRFMFSVDSLMIFQRLEL